MKESGGVGLGGASPVIFTNHDEKPVDAAEGLSLHQRNANPVESLRNNKCEGITSSNYEHRLMTTK